jgi:hypothetical protein
VNKTSHRELPPSIEEVGAAAFMATAGLGFGLGGSLPEPGTGVEILFSLALFFALGALGVELIALVPDKDARELSTCRVGSRPDNGESTSDQARRTPRLSAVSVKKKGREPSSWKFGGCARSTRGKRGEGRAEESRH